MNQILIGISLPFAIMTVFYILKQCRASLQMLVIGPICMCLSALWAVAPDLPRLFGNHRLYSQLSVDPRCNIFFWHYNIDMMETDSQCYTVGFVIIISALLFAAWRELRIAEEP